MTSSTHNQIFDSLDLDLGEDLAPGEVLVSLWSPGLWRGPGESLVAGEVLVSLWSLERSW